MNFIEQNRDFKGVWIPKEIWLNDQLTMLEKVILIEIDSLDNEGHCIAGNEYLAQFCQCSESKVTKAITKLKELGYIEIVSFDGRHRKIRSRLSKSIKQTHTKYEADSEKVLAINIDNNIDTNIDINNNSKELLIEAEASQEVTKEIVVKKKKVSKDGVSSNKRVSRKDQLVNYVNSLDYKEDTKDILFKWIFNVGLPKNVTLNQLTDKLKKIWEECNNEDLVKEAIEYSYLNGYVGFFKPKSSFSPSYSNNITQRSSGGNNLKIQQNSVDKPKIPHYTAEEW